MSPDMRDRFVVLDFEAITDESATCLVTRGYEPLQGAALAFLETFWRVARELAASSDGPTVRPAGSSAWWTRRVRPGAVPAPT
ncbi:hypothetical protein [Pandoraea soli]|uniref:LysR family transcriptional regulator n=1 Tax=Pandoraea soli TaxID=2508293 RepID=A0ABY6W2Q2_9BURK|nr:hypothetical protein [Pandoraea soli]VVE10534.1 LysR family transcriptional regulator [Pandoraea soli]